MIGHWCTSARVGRSLLVGAVITAAPAAAAQDTVKIALIDPVNEEAPPFEFMVDQINAAGGVLGGKQLELVTFTPEFGVEQSLGALNQALEQGIQFVAHGVGSHIALALSEAVAEHNRAHPDARVLYLNYGAIDPSLTNDKCDFWHFRFDADVDMKMEAVTTYVAEHRDQTDRVFLINQDYAFGQSVAAAARRQLEKKAPDIEIVGDELHPLREIKDFAPYVDKIEASAADAVITGNWGDDIGLLAEAAANKGLDLWWYTYYPGGAVRTLKEKGVGRVVKVSVLHENVDNQELIELGVAFKEKYGFEFSNLAPQVKPMMEMLVRALDTAGEPDPLKVALALEGMRHETPLGEVYIRADNHQMIQPLYLSILADDVANRFEDTGVGFKTLAEIPGEATVTETTCEMERPS